MTFDAYAPMVDAKTAALGRLIGALAEDDGTSGVIFFDPAGDRIASSAIDRTTVTIQDVSGGARPLRLEGHEEGVTSRGFTPDGRRRTGSDRPGTAPAPCAR